DVNDAMLRMFGYETKEEITGRNVGNLSMSLNESPFTSEEALRRIRQAVELGSLSFEWSARKTNGEVFWVEVSLRSTQIGGEGRVLAVVRDITERKKAEEALRESEKRFSRLFNNSPSCQIITSFPEGRIEDINEAYCHMLGYSRDEIIGKTSEELNLWATPSERQESYEVFRSQGYVHERTVHFRTRSGNILTMLTSVEPIELKGQTFAISTALDITERKKVEEALQESEEKLRLFIDHAPVALAMFDRDMRYIHASIRWISDYGLFDKEIIGKLHYDIFQEMPKHWKDAHRRGLSGQIVRNEEDTYVRKDGTVQWTRWVVLPWHTASGDVGGIVIFTEDITERKKAEEEKKNLQLQLAEAQKMESVGRLAGGVAHEFNNMLNVIIGYAELSLYKIDPSLPLHDNLIEILKAANRSAEIARKLLAFARKQIFLPKVIDLNETVESMIGELGRLVSDNIRLVWLPAKKLYPVKISPVQIDQILTNLCLNARDAISGSGSITIQTANETLDESYCAGCTGFFPGDFAVLSVSDNGCGMNKETLENIFEPFFTTKEVGKGTGLGMSMVYGIVKQNNGLITVDSEPGKGTTVKIYLPRNESEVSETKTESDIPVGHGETVLLVDDEHQVLMTNKLILEKLGYTVLATETPEEAVRLAEEHAGEIHLLITDVVMPKMNGHDLAIHLHGLYPDMQILYVSGYSANVITEQGMLEKFDDFLQKPFTMKGLAEKIREVMDKK
ncbi:MAG: PAS domain S-box protein, partial [Chlorobiales bacterium]|nr:PAS domain S-box protein [Chlorobiales bacterium]